MVTPVHQGTPAITYSNGAGPGCATSTTLTINAAPTNIIGDLNLCSAGGPTFLSDGSPVGTWTSSNSATATIDINTGMITPVVTPVFPSLPTTLITYSNGQGAGCIAQATATVNPLPQAPVVSGAGTFCGSTTLTATVSGPGTLYFQGATSAGTSLALQEASAIVTNSLTIPTSQNYYFRAITAAGCWGAQGSASVTLNALPASTFSVTGGGTYCFGFTSTLHVGLSGSQASVFNISYALMRDLNPTGITLMGNGGALDFGVQSIGGNYTVVGTNTVTTCSSVMNGSPNNVEIIISPVPNVYNLLGGGTYCATATSPTITLSQSDAGVVYQLYKDNVAYGATVAGHLDGSPINFGTDLGITQFPSGNYTVIANPGAPCAKTMTGTVGITLLDAPSVYVVAGGGAYCAGGSGVPITLSGSQTLTNYELYNSTLSLPEGVLPGTGFELVFNNITAAGTYSIIAANADGCQNTMTLTVTVVVNPKPTAFSMSANGSYCSGGSGVDVSVVVPAGQMTDPAVSYQLLNNTIPVVGAVLPGSGVAGQSLDFGIRPSGNYTVFATNTVTACTNTMTGTTVIGTYTLPAAFNVTGTAGYCIGGNGTPVGLSFSNSGVTYQLYTDQGIAGNAVAVGVPQSGTGAAISFGNQTAVPGTAWTYSVVASGTGGCMTTMNGTAVVSVNPLPTALAFSGGGSYCSGGSGVDLALSGTSSAVSYQLYNGSVAMGSPVIGGGLSTDFGSQMAGGVYSIVGTNMSTGCTNTMTGTATVVVSALPKAYTVTGGGTLCVGGTPAPVGLSNSSVGVSYQLYVTTISGTSSVGTPTVSTGGPLSFPAQSVGGIYTVVADSNGCTHPMSGNVTITVNPLPTPYMVTGGGSLCTGGTGVTIGLSGSNTGINYQLLNNGSSVGTPMAGTGFAISFGLQAAAGSYTVAAINTTTSCTSEMSNTVTVTVNTPPAVYTVTGGGGYCPGGAGVPVGLSNTQSGVSYQLLVGGTPIGAAVTGTTSIAASFGLQTTSGLYTVVATNTVTACTSTTTTGVNVFVNTPPTPFTVTGGGSYCPPPQGSGVDVGLSGSQAGVQYQLYAAGVAAGSALTGTGFALDFNSQAAVGNYVVIATSTITTCTTTMSGSVNVAVNSLPVAYTLSGTGSYCSGGAGVDITLSGTELHTNYQLFHSGSPLGLPVSGSGFAYDFGK